MEDSVNIGLICDEVVPKIPEGHTHLLIEVRSKNYAVLYRLTDGIYQGEISDKMALFGENPNKRESRLFCAYKFGRQFVMELAHKDKSIPLCEGQLQKMRESPMYIPEHGPANIYEYDYDSAHQILIPGDNFDLTVNGSGGKPIGRRKLN